MFVIRLMSANVTIYEINKKTFKDNLVREHIDRFSSAMDFCLTTNTTTAVAPEGFEMTLQRFPLG